VEVCGPGDVLVVTNTAPSTHGMFGDLLAGSLMARGVRGLVIDAGVRDTRDLRAMGFPVWSQHVSCQGTVKSTPGSVNVPVVLGEQIVRGGDVMCCDDDGVVVVAREEADEALALSQARIARMVSRERLNRGELGVDMYGLRATLSRRRGLRRRDRRSRLARRMTMRIACVRARRGGRAIAAGLAAAGVDVRAYEPRHRHAGVGAPRGHATRAVAGAGFVCALTAGADAEGRCAKRCRRSSRRRTPTSPRRPLGSSARWPRSRRRPASPSSTSP
jgi:hypothetical protein